MNDFFQVAEIGFSENKHKQILKAVCLHVFNEEDASSASSC